MRNTRECLWLRDVNVESMMLYIMNSLRCFHLYLLVNLLACKLTFLSVLSILANGRAVYGGWSNATVFSALLERVINLLALLLALLLVNLLVTKRTFLSVSALKANENEHMND